MRRKLERMSGCVKLLLVVPHQSGQGVRRLMHQNVAQHLIQTVVARIGERMLEVARHQMGRKGRRPSRRVTVAVDRRRWRPHRDRVNGRMLRLSAGG